MLERLESDHEFLTMGNVSTLDLIETWISHKRDSEIMPIRQRPHPHGSELYYDI